MHKIWEKDRLYSFLRPYVDTCTKYSYNKAHVRGSLPEDGAVIIAPNHTSTLMDALVVLRSRKKPTVFGARADIFAKPLVARILRFLRILPLATQFVFLLLTSRWSSRNPLWKTDPLSGSKLPRKAVDDRADGSHLLFPYAAERGQLIIPGL